MPRVNIWNRINGKWDDNKNIKRKWELKLISELSWQLKHHHILNFLNWLMTIDHQKQKSRVLFSYFLRISLTNLHNYVKLLQERKRKKKKKVAQSFLHLQLTHNCHFLPGIERSLNGPKKEEKRKHFFGELQNCQIRKKKCKNFSSSSSNSWGRLLLIIVVIDVSLRI